MQIPTHLIKPTCDAASVSTAAVLFLGYLSPAITAVAGLLTITWTLIRLPESIRSLRDFLRR